MTRLRLDGAGNEATQAIGMGEVYAELCAIRRQNRAIVKLLGIVVRDMNRGRDELLEEGRAMRAAADALQESSRLLTRALESRGPG